MVSTIIQHQAGLEELSFPQNMPDTDTSQSLASPSTVKGAQPRGAKCNSWFVMRDLKRSNAHYPAYKLLTDNHFHVFTPIKWVLKTKNGKRIREEAPYIQDLLFVYAERKAVDVIVNDTPTLQYRYKKGGGYCNPMTVRDEDMQRFIRAVRSTDNPRYYLPEELTPQMNGRQIQIVGGPLDGYEGKLITTRGSKKKQLLVELPGLLSVSVEVNPDYIRLVE